MNPNPSCSAPGIVLTRLPAHRVRAEHVPSGTTAEALGARKALAMLLCSFKGSMPRPHWISGPAASPTLAARHGLTYRQRRPGGGRPPAPVNAPKPEILATTIRLSKAGSGLLKTLCVQRRQTQAQVVEAGLLALKPAKAG